MNNEIFNKLKSFVVKHAAIDADEVTREAQIEDHLGVTGDDAVDFLLAFGKSFNVDISKFMAAEYFGPERNVFLSELGKLITGKNKRTRKILTVGHLEKAIISGRLDEEIINS
ncbi:DUF1493 family protein [Longitalea luteola]|uniref:DUF1493 family protein n=1 Tax=Longitalea luteola TaxID=2812563 RepID=UPI001A978042|nr:DUF1493 family protein [Longitalea luteola]